MKCNTVSPARIIDATTALASVLADASNTRPISTLPNNKYAALNGILMYPAEQFVTAAGGSGTRTRHAFRFALGEGEEPSSYDKQYLCYVVSIENPQHDIRLLNEAINFGYDADPTLPTIPGCYELPGDGLDKIQAEIETVAIVADDLGLQHLSPNTLAMIAAYNAGNPEEYGSTAEEINATVDAMEFIQSFHDKQVNPVLTAWLEIIKQSISRSGGSTIQEQYEEIQTDLTNRRAFYLAAQAFLNDPATWAALDAQDTLPDIAGIAEQMRAEGIELHEDATKGGKA